MKALRLHGIGRLQIDQIKVPELTGEEILLQVKACGVCGSDLPRIYQFGTGNGKYPLTLGHEFSGIVADTARTEDRELIGREAAVYPLIPCRTCEYCRTEQYAMCQNYNYLGSRTDGGFAEYCIVPSKWHLAIPKTGNITFEELAMTEPASVAQHAVRKGKVTGGDSVVIFGAGPIGIMAARWCRIFGASKVLLMEVEKEKREIAQGLDLETADNSRNNPAELVRKWNNGMPADVVIEGSGSSGALNQACSSVKHHGRIVLMGNPSGDIRLNRENYSCILRKEISLQGIWNSIFTGFPRDEWSYTIEMIEKGRLKVEDLVTHQVSLEELPGLLEEMHQGKRDVCKTAYTAQGEGGKGL
jgi:L-iditol 2-dehydrogenase